MNENIVYLIIIIILLFSCFLAILINIINIILYVGIYSKKIFKFIKIKLKNIKNRQKYKN